MKKKIKDMSDEEVQDYCEKWLRNNDNGCWSCLLNIEYGCRKYDFEEAKEEAKEDYETELEKIDKAQAEWEEIEVEVVDDE